MFFGLTETDYCILGAAYLLGSIPFGLLISLLFKTGDIRKSGSGNIGATNVLRVGGKKAGILTLILDAGKGAAAVLIAKHYSGYDVAALAGALAVIGHVFPVWLLFKGGKGVATTIAVLAAMYIPLGVFSAATWICIFAITRVSSLASILSMIATPTFALYFAEDIGYQTVYLSLFLGGIVVARHSSNIKRLVRGEEKRVM